MNVDQRAADRIEKCGAEYLHIASQYHQINVARK